MISLILGLAMILQYGYATGGDDPVRIKVLESAQIGGYTNLGRSDTKFAFQCDGVHPISLWYSPIAGGIITWNEANCETGTVSFLDEIPLESSHLETMIQPELEFAHLNPSNAHDFAISVFKEYDDYWNSKNGKSVYVTHTNIMTFSFNVGLENQSISINPDGSLELNNISEHDALLFVVAIETKESLEKMRSWDHEQEELNSKPPSILNTPNGVKFILEPHESLGYSAKSGRTMADTNCSLARIRYIMNNNTKRETILHEMMHVATGCDASKSLHHSIYEIEGGLLELLQDNPDMVDYLTKRKEK